MFSNKIRGEKERTIECISSSDGKSKKKKLFCYKNIHEHGRNPNQRKQCKKSKTKSEKCYSKKKECKTKKEEFIQHSYKKRPLYYTGTYKASQKIVILQELKLFSEREYYSSSFSSGSSSVSGTTSSPRRYRSAASICGS